MAQTHSPATPDDDWRLLRAAWQAAERIRPYLGWPVLLTCVALTLFPALGFDMIGRRGLLGGQYLLTPLGPLAVVTTWLLLGWRHPWLHRRRVHWTVRAILVSLAGVALLLIGALVIAQILQGWLPGPTALWAAARSGAWSPVGAGIVEDFTRLGDRFLLWWTGVQSGSAAQDNLVLAGLLGAALWLLAVLTAWVARARQRGLIAALPTLLLLSFTLLYTTRGRLLLVGALAAAFVLHLLFDQRDLSRRWQTRGIDFNPQILLERLGAVAAIGALVLALAAVMPSVGSQRIAWWYYQQVEPLNERLERTTKRLFPDARAGGGIFGGGVAGGLPNQFLITSGDAPRDTEVMRVRTNEAARPDAPPPGHYMRSGAFSDYDGRGWGNPDELVYVEGRANEPVLAQPGRGRKPLLQNVFLTFNSRVLYAAGEPMAPDTPYRAALRSTNDLATLSAPARSYTIVSQVPAVSEETLAQAAGWSAANPLPEAYAMHLVLPDTVTDRTRALVDDVTGDLESPFAKATAIEQHLRGYAYDLTVPLPPDEVADVADYFLFDLQRGYCDYYATAFVVMARLAGLPARFATGFAVGSWDTRDMTFVITEAEAHSWPEVYFPEYGWIPFEPTAGRPVLVRPEDALPAGDAAASTAVPEAADDIPSAIEWNWQMLFWLLPLGLLLWGGLLLAQRLRLARQDPWVALLRWGAGAGRPMADAETALEYGRGLSDHILMQTAEQPEIGRIAARETSALSRDVTELRYGPETVQQEAATRVTTRWPKLRSYLRRL